jgi:hypothetical protein
MPRRCRVGDAEAGDGSLSKGLSRPDARLYCLTGANMNVTNIIQDTPGSSGLGQGLEPCYDRPYAQRRVGHVCPTYQLSTCMKTGIRSSTGILPVSPRGVSPLPFGQQARPGCYSRARRP